MKLENYFCSSPTVTLADLAIRQVASVQYKLQTRLASHSHYHARMSLLITVLFRAVYRKLELGRNRKMYINNDHWYKHIDILFKRILKAP